jgi:exodeoxyribonuclease VII large subunit
LSRRFENFNLMLYPVSVQGVQAASTISRAIKRLNQLNCVDVIILARGGGSLEELWAFNEEQVARSIFESKIPVISAVGHETDFTIADFVADLRAPTPSAAAELVVPEKRALKQKNRDLRQRLQNAILKNIDINRTNLRRHNESIVFRQPYNRINQEKMRLDSLERNLILALTNQKEKEKAKMKFLIEKLNVLSPLNILARGYSIVKLKESNKLVKSVEDINAGDNIEINVVDGLIEAIVINGEVKDGRE